MKRSRPTLSERSVAGFPMIAAAIGVGLIIAVSASGFVVNGPSNEAIHPATMAMMLALVALPLIRWASGGDKLVQQIMITGLVAKALGTAARVIFNAGGADAGYYNSSGAEVARLLGDGFVWPGDPRVPTRGTGTTNLTYMVGWLYNLSGVRFVTAYVVFSFIAFVGMLLLYRAAVNAFPEIDRVRYALLLFLLPSMLFWPSSLGKDAWMVGCLGLAAWGASGLLRNRYSVGPIVALAAGIGLTAWIRPHIAALFTLALVVATIWPQRSRGSRGRQLLFSLVALAVLTVVLGQVADYFGSERFEVTALLDETADRTAQGGSEFTAVRVSGPLSLALAAVTVLFRPLPFEASSSIQLISSVEGVAVLALGVASLARLRTLPRAFRDHAYVRFVTIYTLGFIVAFSVISNFGILARQRAQLWPFLLVLLALPRRDRLVAPDDTPSTDSHDQPTATGSDVYVP